MLQARSPMVSLCHFIETLQPPGRWFDTVMEISLLLQFVLDAFSLSFYTGLSSDQRICLLSVLRGDRAFAYLYFSKALMLGRL